MDLTEATLGQDGQLIITGEDGQGKLEHLLLFVKMFLISNNLLGYPVSVSGMITVPMSAQMYQTMVANIQHLQPNSDGTLCITPMQVQNFMASCSNSNISSNFPTHVMAGAHRHKFPATTEISTIYPKVQISTPSVASPMISKKKLKYSVGSLKTRVHSQLINNNSANIQNKNLSVQQLPTKETKRVTKPNKNFAKESKTIVIINDDDKKDFVESVKLETH